MTKHLVLPGLLSIMCQLHSMHVIRQLDNDEQVAIFGRKIALYKKGVLKRIDVSHFLGPLTITDQAYPEHAEFVVVEYSKAGAEVKVSQQKDDVTLGFNIQASEPVSVTIYTAGSCLEALEAHVYGKHSLSLSGPVAQNIHLIADQGDITTSKLQKGKITLRTEGTIRVKDLSLYSGHILALAYRNHITFKGEKHGQTYEQLSDLGDRASDRMHISTNAGKIILLE